MTSTPDSPRTRTAPRELQARGQEKRRAILEAVIAVVGREGSAAVTHRRVAEVAGVSLSATTYYFDSKQQLVGEGLKMLVAEEMARIESRLDGLAGSRLTPAEIAVEIASWYGDDASGDPQGWIVLLELATDAARAGVLADDLAAANAALDAQIDAALRLAGEPGPRDAAALRACMDGLVIEQLFKCDPTFVSTVLQPTLHRLISLMLGEGSG
ncbi:MAG: TetR family transcriptional regulator [Actinobacteria bacterium]|nr:TetR family transcriptional regulator [Actinomycetota bacterium]OJU80538.1 MAG: hypothetical protein BGO11_07370 [Solirubrobacterales bacterium 70-9]